MKNPAARLFIGLGLAAATTVVLAGEFHSVIITSSPLMLNINDEHSLRISNFTQEGGAQRGVVAVTTSAGTTNVMAATVIDPSAVPSSSVLEPINQIVIAGPAQVTVAAVDGAKLFITYRKQLDEQGGTPSSTAPVPTATATATVTATATPTPTPTATP
jgi:hypothetical protein